MSGISTEHVVYCAAFISKLTALARTAFSCLYDLLLLCEHLSFRVFDALFTIGVYGFTSLHGTRFLRLFYFCGCRTAGLAQIGGCPSTAPSGTEDPRLWLRVSDNAPKSSGAGLLGWFRSKKNRAAVVGSSSLRQIVDKQIWRTVRPSRRRRWFIGFEMAPMADLRRIPPLPACRLSPRLRRPPGAEAVAALRWRRHRYSTERC